MPCWRRRICSIGAERRSPIRASSSMCAGRCLVPMASADTKTSNRTRKALTMRQLFRGAGGAAILLFLTAGVASADDDVIANLGSQPVKASDLKDLVDSLN